MINLLSILKYLIMNNRKETEREILHIISYIDSENTLQPLVWSLKFFWTEELFQLLSFLKTWNYKPIYILLDKKIKQYLEIKQEIKWIQIWNKMNYFKEKEKSEKKQENINLEKILEF